MRFFTDICPTQGGLARIQKCQLSEEFGRRSLLQKSEHKNQKEH
jgi:hypothetical protein